MLRLMIAILALAASARAMAQSLTDEQKTELSQYFGFGPMQIYKIKPGIYSLKLADLNADGRTDIALWNSQRSRIELFYQRSEKDPPAAPAAELERNELPDRGDLRRENVPVAYRLASMEIAELTGDKRVDIVFFGEPKEIVILPGREDGGFGPAQGIRAPEGEARGGALAVGDYNHDGRTDVALLGTELIQIYHQKPEGGLSKPIRLAHSIKQPLLMMTSDLNGDSRDDLIITADDDQYGAYAFLQEGDGHLGPLRRAKMPKVRSMTVAHGAGGDDLYPVEYATGRLKHCRWEVPKDVAGTRDWPQKLYSYPQKTTSKRRPVAIGDLTGDGIPDVVAGDPDSAQVVLYRGGADGLEPAASFPALTKTLDLFIGDLDGDGKSELLSASAEEKMIGVSRYADGRLTFPAATESKGEPLTIAVGARKAAGPADTLAYATRIDDEIKLFVRPAKGGDPTEVVVKEIDDDPAAIRFADVNQDGRNDLLMFVRFNPLLTWLQKEDGSFEPFTGADTKATLVKEASPEGFALSDVTGDGKPEIILSQKSFARALVVRDNQWSVIDQYNPESAGAQVTGVAALPGAPGSPTIVLYDRNGRELLVQKRREDKTYAVTNSIPIGNFDLSAMDTLTLGKAGAAALLMADAERLATFTPDEVAPSLVEKHTYESETKDAHLADAVVGDVNGDGVRDVSVIDTGKARIEVLTLLPDGAFVKALGFQVFQGRRFSDDPGRTGEPHEVLCGDVTGDKIDDIVLLVHDRMIVYPGQ